MGVKRLVGGEVLYRLVVRHLLRVESDIDTHPYGTEQSRL